MKRYAFQFDLAIGDTFNPKALRLPRKCYGMRIAADSELDMVIVSQPGQPVPPYVGALAYAQGGNVIDAANAATPGTDFLASAMLPSTSAHLVSVERPLLAVLEPGLYTLSCPRRAALGGGLRGIRGMLELLEDPAEAMFAPTKRAPFVADATISPNNGESTYVYFPVFGRKLLAFDLYLAAAGAGGITWQLDGERVIWDDGVSGGRVTTASFIASRTDTVAATEVTYDGDTEIDWLKLTITAVAAGTQPRAVVHVRAED